MPASIRQQIIDAVETRLKTIKVANGYETDIGLNVNVWHVTDLQEPELPAIDIRDTSESIEVRGGNHICTLTIEIEAKVSGASSGVSMRDILADIIKAVGTDPSFSGLVQETKPLQNDSFGFGKQDKTIASILMTFEMRYLVKAFKPYTLA